MADFDNAEIIDVEEVPGIPKYNPNRTDQVLGLVQITPNIKVNQTPESKRGKLTKESISNILKLYENYSQEFGFTAKWDIASIQSTFGSIIDDDQEKIFRIVLSKAYGKWQLSIYQQAMIAIDTLMGQVTSDQVLNDMTVSVEWKFGMIQQLIGLMQQVSEIYEKVRIENPDIILKNIASKSQNNEAVEFSRSPQSIQIMRKLRDISLQMKVQENDDNQ